MNSRAFGVLIVMMGVMGLLMTSAPVMAAQQTMEFKVPGCE